MQRRKLRPLKGHYFVTQGTKDTAVDPVSADQIIAVHEGPEQLWKADMGLVFYIFVTENTLDELIDVTNLFFKKHDD